MQYEVQCREYGSPTGEWKMLVSSSSLELAMQTFRKACDDRKPSDWIRIVCVLLEV